VPGSSPPGMTESPRKDAPRYLDSYRNTILGIWMRGDFAMRDAGGGLSIH